MELLTLLPEDMHYVIESYLPIDEIRKYLICKKYYKQCYLALQQFTIQELNMHFHKDDYFGMNNNKRVSINNYISYNLINITPFTIKSRFLHDQYIDIESYENLKKIIICSRIKSAITRIKKREK
jgi:hypothetical protein